MAEIVTIDAIRHQGDGVARTAGGPLYVPFALPGERVRIERDGDRGRLVEVLEPSPDRADPICRHFGTCGGCALQMMPLAETRQLKRGFVVAALARERIETDVAETIGVKVASRRRAVVSAIRIGKRVVLGFNERLSNRIVDIEECPVLVGALRQRLPAMRVILEGLVGTRKPARVTALLTRNGIDLDVSGGVAPKPEALPRLAALARDASLARLTMDGEPVLTLAEPQVEISGVSIAPPPGGFLQASTEAERIMAKLVAEHLADARDVADLFSGIGTFTFALARHASLRAVESDAAALDALSQAARHASGLKRVETERRDLFKHPLSPAELNRHDGVVFDPPRVGARAQATAVAASRVPRIAAVSCNPASFARDAGILVDGGYRLEKVVPIDQFVYSAETEVVGLFSRP